MESPSADEDGDCFSPLSLNATSVNIEVYYNKAVNYTLMVTFVSLFILAFDFFMLHCIYYVKLYGLGTLTILCIRSPFFKFFC